MSRPEHVRWLKANHHDLAPLTGTDHAALLAIAATWDLFAQTRAASVLDAVAILVTRMQPKTRDLARELIARSMDWDDRERYWPRVEAEAARLEAEGIGGLIR